MTATPAAPTTSGNALLALTTTGVPQASASSAASPNVSTGPGASTTSAVASNAARSTRSCTHPVNTTGSPSARRARRLRCGPSPATTSTAGTPAARSAATASIEHSARFSTDSRPQWTMSTASTAAKWSRNDTVYRSGENRSRSTPSGTRTRFATPSRSNSFAAQSVVHTTRV